jgi:uncharacterized membrane protein
MSPISRLQAAGLVAALALAAERDVLAQPVSVTEKGDHATEAVVIVNAPPAAVYELATDYGRWTQMFSDIRSVTVEGGGRRDAKVRFRSAALGHEVAVKFDNVANESIRFVSVDAPPGAHATGIYMLEPLANGTRTKIVASLYLDVSGIAGVFMSNKKLRGMRQAKLRADLGDVAAHFASRPQASSQ